MSLQKISGRACLFRKKNGAKILFGRDFSSDIFWSGFFFKHFSVGMSLQKKSGIEHVSSEKKGGECLCKDFAW